MASFRCRLPDICNGDIRVDNDAQKEGFRCLLAKVSPCGRFLSSSSVSPFSSRIVSYAINGLTVVAYLIWFGFPEGSPTPMIQWVLVLGLLLAMWLWLLIDRLHSLRNLCTGFMTCFVGRKVRQIALKDGTSLLVHPNSFDVFENTGFVVVGVGVPNVVFQMNNVSMFPWYCCR